MLSTSEDRISTLPEDIIVSIISRLQLKEAARTSLLSHRWRDLWTHTSILNFVKSADIYDVVCGDKEEYSIDSKCRFIEWVNLVLGQLKGHMLDEFKICFNLAAFCSDVINDWIKFALKRHVKKLVLDFVSHDCWFGSYVLSAQVFSNSSGSLTTLILNRVQVTGDVLGYVTSSFPLLQVLHVESSSSLVELKLCGPLPSLRCLEIMHCCSMRYLEVHANNLVSFAYHGPKIRVLFKEESRFVEANLSGSGFMIDDIWHCFSHLESLILEFNFLSALLMQRESPVLPNFGKLKRLELSLSGVCVAHCVVLCTMLLKASPFLQRFVMKIHYIKWIGAAKIPKSLVGFQHDQLKVVEFVGFLGNMKDVCLVKRLLAKLPSLVKVCVDLSPICRLRSPELGDLRTAVARAQQLQTSLPPGAELVVIASNQKSNSSVACKCSTSTVT